MAQAATGTAKENREGDREGGGIAEVRERGKINKW
jgi:hypothetical protein